MASKVTKADIEELFQMVGITPRQITEICVRSSPIIEKNKTYREFGTGHRYEAKKYNFFEVSLNDSGIKLFYGRDVKSVRFFPYDSLNTFYVDADCFMEIQLVQDFC